MGILYWSNPIREKFRDETKNKAKLNCCLSKERRKENTNWDLSENRWIFETNPVDSLIIGYDSIALIPKCYTNFHSRIRWSSVGLAFCVHRTPRHRVWYWMTPLELRHVVPLFDRQCLTHDRPSSVHRREIHARKDNLPLGTSCFEFASPAVRRIIDLHTRQSIVHLGDVVDTSQCYFWADELNRQSSLLCHQFPSAQPSTMVRDVRFCSLAYWHSQQWT